MILYPLEGEKVLLVCWDCTEREKGRIAVVARGEYVRKERSLSLSLNEEQGIAPPMCSEGRLIIRVPDELKRKKENDRRKLGGRVLVRGGKNVSSPLKQERPNH